MFHFFQRSSRGAFLWGYVLLVQLSAVDIVECRSFTYDSVSVDSLTTSLPSTTSETLFPLTSTQTSGPDLPYTITYSRTTSSDTVTWGPLTPSSSASAYTSQASSTVSGQATPVTSYSQSVTSRGLPTSSSSSAPISNNSPALSSTTRWSNSTTSSSTTTSLSPSSISQTTWCTRGTCLPVTNSSKTETTSSSTNSSPTTTYTYSNYTSSSTVTSSVSCITLSPGDPGTVWSILPNTETTTITITGNLSSTYSTTPEFTPPIFCPTTPALTTSGTVRATETASTSPVSACVSCSSISPQLPVQTTTYTRPALTRAPTTIITTSKNPVTVFTTESAPFPSDAVTGKQTVTPTSSDTVTWGPLTPPPATTAIQSTTASGGSGAQPGGTQPGGAQSSPIQSGGGQPSGSQPGEAQPDGAQSLPVSAGGGSQPTTTTVGGVSILISPTQVVIGGQTVSNEGSTTEVIANGQTFTVNPSQVIAPGVTIPIPTIGGGIFMPLPTPITVDGVPIQLEPSAAVIEGTTYAIGLGASQQTIVVSGQIISIGPGGLGFAQTTVAPPSVPTNVVIVDGQVISAVGASEAIIGGSTFFYGPLTPPQTDVFNGETITIGPGGISYGSFTLGGASHPSGIQLGIAGGLSVTEVGSSIAIISGTTFTVGPHATPTTAVINGETIIAGSAGLTIAGATLTYPYNQVTQAITAGGITFSEIGASLVNIGGTTYTIGPGAKTTTDVYNGQTISLGPGGVGFKTTTITATIPSLSSPTSSASAKHTGKKNGTGNLKPIQGVLGICIAIGVGYNT